MFITGLVLLYRILFDLANAQENPGNKTGTAEVKTN